MLSAAARARLTVVLVGARNPANIGAAARAMQDFGFSDLRVVNDFAPPFEAAQLESKAAVAAQHVMAAAQRFDTLAEALVGCSLVVGTTAIGGRELTQPVLPLQQAAPRILQALSQDAPPLDPTPSTRNPGIALLFGSEKTGLTRDQLSHCGLLTTIPMFAPQAPATESGETGGKPPRHLSMNLGQSVAVCLYELTRDGFEGARELPALHEALATHDDRERLTQLLLDVMHTTGYTRRFPANATEPLVRQLTLQLGTTHREAMTWMGILRQILFRTQPDPTATDSPASS